MEALHSLFFSLSDGGHLLIVDNPRVKGGGARGGLFRRVSDTFEVVELTADPPEILDLILALNTAGKPPQD